MHIQLKCTVLAVFLASCGFIRAESGSDAALSASLDQSETELRAKISNLERQLAGAKSIISESRAKKEEGYLEKLERKALAYEAASSAIAERDRALAVLQEEVNELRAENGLLKTEVKALATATNELTASIEILRKESEPLKEALTLIRKGKFEYYQIKEGDTCESIAAKPSIYNDSKKHILIRQANRGGVADLDNLAPGEVLVIPRFSIGESYEF